MEYQEYAGLWNASSKDINTSFHRLNWHESEPLPAHDDIQRRPTSWIGDVVFVVSFSPTDKNETKRFLNGVLQAAEFIILQKLIVFLHDASWCCVIDKATRAFQPTVMGPTGTSTYEEVGIALFPLRTKLMISKLRFMHFGTGLPCPHCNFFVAIL